MAMSGLSTQKQLEWEVERKRLQAEIKALEARGVGAGGGRYCAPLPSRAVGYRNTNTPKTKTETSNIDSKTNRRNTAASD